jgi:hypothetical protein
MKLASPVHLISLLAFLLFSAFANGDTLFLRNIPAQLLDSPSLDNLLVLSTGLHVASPAGNAKRHKVPYRNFTTSGSDVTPEVDADWIVYWTIEESNVLANVNEPSRSLGYANVPTFKASTSINDDETAPTGSSALCTMCYSGFGPGRWGFVSGGSPTIDGHALPRRPHHTYVDWADVTNAGNENGTNASTTATASSDNAQEMARLLGTAKGTENSVAIVPEPGSIAFLGTGLISVAFFFRRRFRGSK